MLKRRFVSAIFLVALISTNSQATNQFDPEVDHRITHTKDIKDEYKTITFFSNYSNENITINNLSEKAVIYKSFKGHSIEVLPRHIYIESCNEIFDTGFIYLSNDINEDLVDETIICDDLILIKDDQGGVL